jgi:hypothetical protein
MMNYADAQAILDMPDTPTGDDVAAILSMPDEVPNGPTYNGQPVRTYTAAELGIDPQAAAELEKRYEEYPAFDPMMGVSEAGQHLRAAAASAWNPVAEAIRRSDQLFPEPEKIGPFMSQDMIDATRWLYDKLGITKAKADIAKADEQGVYGGIDNKLANQLGIHNLSDLAVRDVSDEGLTGLAKYIRVGARLGGGLAGVVARVSLLKSAMGGAAAGDIIPFAAESAMTGGSPTEGAFFGGTMGYFGALNPASRLGRVGSKVGEGGTFGWLGYESAKAQGASEAEAQLEGFAQGLVPVGIHGYRAIRETFKGRMRAADTPQKRAAAIAEVVETVGNAKVVEALTTEGATKLAEANPAEADALASTEKPSRTQAENMGAKGLDSEQRVELSRLLQENAQNAPEVLPGAIENRPSQGARPAEEPAYPFEPGERVTWGEGKVGTVDRTDGQGYVYVKEGAAEYRLEPGDLKLATASSERPANVQRESSAPVETSLEGNQPTQQGWKTPEGKLRLDESKADESRIARENAETGQGMLGGSKDAAGYIAPQRTGQGRPKYTPAEGSAEGLRQTLRPMPMPELVQLAKGIMGRYPDIAPLRKWLGMFRAEGTGSIKIDPKVAKDPRQLAEVLAHEIGHAVDYLPDRTLARGNLLGRLASLQKHMKNVMGGMQNKAVRDELIALTEWWNPYVKSEAPKGYIKYRESPRELYAEALSVFLNTPGELQSRAPKFYDALLKYFNRKPEVLDEYLTLQDILNGDSPAVAEARRRNVQEMFARGDEKIKAAAAAREAANQSVIEGVRQFLGQYVLDTSAPVKRRVSLAEKRGETFSEHENARYLMDELFMLDNPNHVMLNRVQGDVYAPLLESGVNKADMGEYLMMRRVVNERGELANPLGYTPEAAAQQLEGMRQRLGPERFARLEAGMKQFHDIVFESVERAVEADVYNRETFKTKIEPNRDNYATFAVIKHLEDHVPAGIYKQVGTFNEIANPFDATLMKTVTLNRLIDLNIAKRSVRDLLRGSFPGEIIPAEIPYKAREPNRPARPGFDHLLMLEDGQARAYEVPSEIAISFQRHDIGGLAKFGQFIGSPIYKVLHPVLVTYNPGFQVANPFRDFWRTYKNLAAIGGKDQKITLRDVLKAYWQAIPASKRRAQGIDDATINQMLAEKALGIPFVDPHAVTDAAGGYERLIERHGLGAEKLESQWKAVRGAKRVLNLIEAAGVLQETASKVAAFNLLGEKGVTGKERAFIVRKYVGTPDYSQRGHVTSLTNPILLYSRVRWNGLQADMQLATGRETRAGWWWRQTAFNVMPKVAMRAALFGVFGATVKAIMEDTSEYLKANYTVIPLGRLLVGKDRGKSIVLTMPTDDTGQLIGNLTWRMMDAVMGSATGENPYTQALSELYGQAIPAANPIIDAAYKWMQFASGVNPLDSRTGRPVVPESEWTAGGWYSGRRMAAWTLNKFGVVSTIMHAATGPMLGDAQESGEESTVETVLRSAPGISRLLRITDRGREERQWATIENEDEESARFRLSLPDTVRKATAERYLLDRRGKKELSPAENQRRLRLNSWYSGIYLPLTRQMKLAKDAGNTERLRSLLESRTRAYLSN